MAPIYVSPNGSGLRDGSSIENAGTLASLNQFIQAAGPGGEVLLLADQGAYQQNTQLSISKGGTDGASKHQGKPKNQDTAGSKVAGGKTDSGDGGRAGQAKGEEE